MAEYAFKKADSLNPNMAYNHYHRSWYLFLFGNLDMAIAEHTRAQELDPFTPMHTAWLAALYLWAEEYDLALAELEKVFEMSQGKYALAMALKGRVLLDQGKIEEGLESLRQACEINKGWYVYYGPALVNNGKEEEALKILEEVKNMPDAPYINMTLARIYAAYEDADKAFEHLNKAKKSAWYPWVIRIFLADTSIKEDPRYMELLWELKLPPIED